MTPQGTSLSRDLTIISDLAEARQLQQDIEAMLQKWHFDEREIYCVKLALEEALVNAIKHGNQMDTSKKVFISMHFSQTRFDIKITDEGPGFNPEDVPDPTDPENLERACGRGLLLMRHYMTEVTYHSPGNSVSMSKVKG